MTYASEQNKLKVRIMRRVYFSWFAKKVINPLTLKGAFLLAFVWQILINVSFANVLANASSATGGASSVYKFFTYAIMHTELAVQAFSVGLAFLLVWIVLDIRRSLRSGNHGVAHVA